MWAHGTFVCPAGGQPGPNPLSLTYKSALRIFAPAAGRPKWCQDLPLPELAAHLKELGFDGVDLPCRPGAPIGPEDAPKMLPEAKKVFDDHGIALERLVTGITEANDVNDHQLEAIRAAGVKRN